MGSGMYAIVCMLVLPVPWMDPIPCAADMQCMHAHMQHMCGGHSRTGVRTASGLISMGCVPRSSARTCALQ